MKLGPSWSAHLTDCAPTAWAALCPSSFRRWCVRPSAGKGREAPARRPLRTRTLTCLRRRSGSGSASAAR
eukprot:11063321-Alexandrium_andersonii.AAC.1